MKKGSLHLKLAKALYTLARKEQQSAQFLTELTTLSELLTDQALLAALERMSQATQSQIAKILQKVFGKQLSTPVRNLLTLLVASRQVAIIPDLKAAFQKIHFEAEGIRDFQICVSRDLSEQEKDALSDSFGTNKKVYLAYTTDPSLIGGIQIYENGLLTDYSVKNQLEHLRRTLMGEHLV